MTDVQDRPAAPYRGYREPERPLAGIAGWVVIAVTLSVAAAAISFVAIAVAGRSETTKTAKPATNAAASAEPVRQAMTLGDMFIKPASVTVAAGADVTIDVTNTGAIPHNLTVKGTATTTGNIAPGKSATLHVGTVSKSIDLICSIPGHEQAGMISHLVVAGTTTAPGGAAKDATIDATATPPAGWHARSPVLQPAPGGTVHVVTLRATETVLEVAPGVRQQMWTFNNQVPGPILRGHVGDVFKVTLINDGKMGHSIDFHASEAPWDTQMRTIQPGERLQYDFRANFAGIWMYHCGTAPALHHIGNGMYGAVVIDPPGLPKVDHEYVIVQSELYLGPQGQPGDLDKMTSVQPDGVVFNGYWNQYKFAPIQVQPGEKIRVWVLDAGPSENSSFHIVGTIFDTVFKEGTYLLRPDARRGGSQSLDLQPAQGGFVEFTAGKVGLYPIVTHKFANVGKGALGLFEVGTATMPAGAGH